jgi:hypothetical protein
MTTKGRILGLALVAGILVAVMGASTAHAGIKGLTNSKQNQNQDKGPLGLPALKVLADALALTNAQENQILIWYDDAKHKEKENDQFSKNKNNSGPPPNDLDKLRGEIIDAIKKILTPDQVKKFEGLLSQTGKKKKT